MATCEHCRELLFDHVYGLLEGAELQEVAEHLNSCSECKAALDRVVVQQNLLAHAALAITKIPEFSNPDEAPVFAEEKAPVNITAASPQPAPVPEERKGVDPGLPQRSWWRRPWLAWATAAAILLAVSTAISLYRSNMESLKNELAARKQEHKDVDQQVAALPVKYAALEQTARHEIRGAANPYLHVVGPTQLHPGAKANLHITTRHVEGDPAQANLHFTLVESDTRKVVQQGRLDTTGETRVEIDSTSARPNSKLELIVEAQTRSGEARVIEVIQVPASSQVTRIDTNKLAYQIRDVLFFRVLVLDRTTLAPPANPVLVNVKLLNPKGEVVRQAQLPTGAGGVAAGEWGIEDHFLAGNYQLQVSGAGDSHSVQQASQHLEVVRELRVAGINFDQRRYRPGDMVTGSLPPGPVAPGMGGGAMGGFAAPGVAVGSFGNQTVPVTIQPEFRPQALAARAVGAVPPPLRKDDSKKADPAKENKAVPAGPSVPMRFEARIPKDLPPGANNIPFRIQLQNGKKKVEYSAVVPLQPTDLGIDFFPEGGDLIAGIQNRVFYRVRTKAGEPVTGDGRVILLSSKNEVVDSPYQFGLGYFDFTPRSRETYTVRITSPLNTSEIGQPFARLGIRSSGVVLHVSDAVGKQGEPIRLTLRNQGPERKLMLAVSCRGQIVDQQWIDVKSGEQDFTLQTTPVAHGMLCVTAYEVDGASLEPVAERLVYRTAAERLDLGITLNTQQLRPGQHIVGKISARDEKGRDADGWVLASAVDERFQKRQHSLSAHFLLLNEIRAGADLDDARLIVHDSPESVQMLERFLGTHGWRRFVRSGNNPIAAAQIKRPADLKGIFSRENMPFDALQKQYDDKLTLALAPIRQNAVRERIDLDDQRERSTEAMRLAAMHLVEFETNVQVWIRIALGFVVVVLLGVSLVLMVIGAYRILRIRAATPAFGSAFACLALCMMMILLGGALGSIEVAKIILPGNSPLAALGELQHPRLAKINPKGEPVPAGDFAIDDRQQRRANVGEREEPSMNAAAKRDAVALLDQLAKTLAEREQEEGLRALGQERGMAVNKLMQQRFRNATAGGPIPQPSPPPHKTPAPTSPTISGDGKEKQKELQESRTREYAYEHAPNLASDTLLWSPTLRLAKGSADVRFDIASGQATYRILLLGHTSNGRFGFLETRLDISAVDR